MKEIFSISPFVRRDKLPRKTSIESIILNNFYLFNGYDKNPYIVRDYMNFIDSNFDFVFSKLGLTMISYEYPDNVEYGSWQMIEYINDKYDLVGNNKMDREYRLDSIEFKDPISGKINIFRFNEYAMYDIGLLNKSIFDDVDNRIIRLLRFMSKYLINKNDKRILNDVLDFIEYTNSMIVDRCSELYEIEFICEPVLILCQLKSYVKYLYEERRE